MSLQGAEPTRVAVVAGELSGDALAAGLMRELAQRRPSVRFEGIGGPRMAEQGLESLVPMEALSLMGITEVLRHLPRLLQLRRELVRRWIAEPPAVFIGVDLPDFNLGLERRLRRSGVPAVHYVSPTVWAWRRGRIRGIRRSVDRMLTLYPFEQAFYARSGLDAVCVGHPAADRYPLVPDQGEARRAIGLPEEGEVVALLPGSRRSEVERLGEPFAEAAARLATRPSAPRFVVPVAQEALRDPIEGYLHRAGVRERCWLLDGDAPRALVASDFVLTTSGTATLEALLAKRPMVSAYRLAPLTFYIVRWLIQVSWSSTPNLLAGEELVPERFQDEVTGEGLAAIAAEWLDDPGRCRRLQERFTQLHRTLARGADARAAEAVAAFLPEDVPAEAS